MFRKPLHTQPAKMKSYPVTSTTLSKMLSFATTLALEAPMLMSSPVVAGASIAVARCWCEGPAFSSMLSLASDGSLQLRFSVLYFDECPTFLLAPHNSKAYRVIAGEKFVGAVGSP